MDSFRFSVQYEDSQPCGAFIFDNDGAGIRTPNYPEEEGCGNLGTIRVTLTEAKKVKFNITFLDIEREDQPDYPLFVNPPSFTGSSYAKATLRDQRVPFMRDAWNCVCQTQIGAQQCNFESNTNASGRAEFTLPVFQSMPATQLTGTFRYRKDRPDIAVGAYEFADCNYRLDPSTNILASTVNQTVRCEVDRRGPPEVEITRIATDAAFNQGTAFQTQFLFDDLVTVEAEGEDLNQRAVTIFYWTDIAQTRLAANSRSATRQASHLFGTGQNLGIKAHGVDYYGWRGTDSFSGISVQEVEVEVWATQERIAIGATTLMTSQVTGANNTGVTWSVNDPTIATIDENGVLTSHSPGEVTVTGRSQADLTATDQVVVEVANLMAAFAVNPAAGDSTTVFTFDGSLSLGDIILHEWEFGDNATATGEVVQHTFGSSGVFEVQLTVHDQDGLIARTVRPVSATGRPVAVIQADPSAGTPPLTVQFDGSGSFAVSGDIVRWDWDFGDGNTAEGETTQHTFLNPGEYMSMLTVEDGTGQTAADSLMIIVAAGPLAQFTVTPGSGEPPLEVVVDASSSEGNIIRYSWDFGDGMVIPNGLPVESHTYVDAGFYEITLEIEDELGITDTATASVVINCENLHQGTIVIQNESDLQSLFGFCGVDGNLVIFNSTLENMEGFSFISVVTGMLDIRFNPQLKDLSGLEQMIEIGSLSVTNNQQLESIAALQNVRILNEVNISSNNSLVDLDIFRNITHIDGRLLLSNVPVERLPDFPQLVYAGEIYLGPLNNLVSLEGLENLEEVGQLNLTQMPELSDLSGLAGLTGAYIVFLANLPSLLPDARFPALVRAGRIFLENIPQIVDLGIFNNLEEVIDVQTQGGQLAFKLADHPEIGATALHGADFKLSLDNLATNGYAPFDPHEMVIAAEDPVALDLSLTNLQALFSLSGMESIDRLRNVTIRSVPSLTSLDGLQNLEQLRNLLVENAPSMTSMNGLGNVSSLNNLQIIGSGLASLAGLEQITRIGTLYLSDMPDLANLNGLSGLTHLERLNMHNNVVFGSFQ